MQINVLNISQQLLGQKMHILLQQQLIERIDHIFCMDRLCHKLQCKFVRCASFLLLLFPIWLSASPVADERLEYTISYQGGLSAMAWLDICDAVLETSQQAVTVDGEKAYKAVVQITSEHHEKMESLYPFRFQLMSYFSTDMQRAILFDKRKKTRKDRHEIIRFDWDERVTERYKRRKSKQGVDPAAGQAAKSAGVDEAPGVFSFLGYDSTYFRRSGKPGQKLSVNMLDRLSLLQAVRSQKLAIGEERRLTISDGKKVLNYLVRVQTRESLKQDDQKREFLKVRFDAFKAGKWSGTPAHPAVFIWVTADDLQIPVRFSIDYAMGTFIVQLKQKVPGQAATIANAFVPTQPSQAR